MYWIEIYPRDSVFHLSNNCAQQSNYEGEEVS